jgi:hypothetical protein
MGLAEVVPIRLWRHLARRQVVAFMYAAAAERSGAARLLAGTSEDVLEQICRTLGCLSTRLRPRDHRPTPALRRALAEACAEELPAELLKKCLDVSLRSGQMEVSRLFWQVCVRRRVARTTLSCGARLCPGAKLSVSIGLGSGQVCAGPALNGVEGLDARMSRMVAKEQLWLESARKLPLQAAVGVVEALWSARAAAASGVGLLADCHQELNVGGIDEMRWDDPDLCSALQMCEPDSGHQVQQSAGSARPPAVSTQALFQRTLIHLLPLRRGGTARRR